MSDEITITSAGNTAAPAFALLKELGFEVTHVRDPSGRCTEWLEAKRDTCVLRAEDPLALLGLAKLAECKGAAWRSSQEEIDAFLDFASESV
jgi:xanthine/CO dehydrogenase XdhC/CoxF family maturation factor